MTAARTAVLMKSKILVPAGSLAVAGEARAHYDHAAHRGETGAEPCLYRVHDDDHAATVRLTPDPDQDRSWAHEDVLTVCWCCAFAGGHLYDEMRGQARTSGHVGVELRQDDGRWLS